MAYNEEDYLMISEIQHYEFCKRQWALIHIEQQWEENYLTVDGEIMHKHAHDQKYTESRNGVISTRGLPVHSSEYGISGVCDVVEFVRDDEHGYEIYQREGKYRIFPVEYKHGEPKEGLEDILQVALQAICLEEMLCCRIDMGYLFYGKTRRRFEVSITEDVRAHALRDIQEMHQYYDRKFTPKVKPTKKCNACSLKELCMPKLMKDMDVNAYIARTIGEDY